MLHTYSFTVVLEPEPEGGFTVLVPALPEVVTFGDTEAEALAMAEDAARLALEVRRERQEPIPGEGGAHTQIRRLNVAVPA